MEIVDVTDCDPINPLCMTRHNKENHARRWGGRGRRALLQKRMINADNQERENVRDEKEKANTVVSLLRIKGSLVQFKKP